MNDQKRKRRKLGGGTGENEEEGYDYIYYQFLSSLVNNETYNPTETMIDSREFYKGMELFLDYVIVQGIDSLGKEKMESFKNGFNKGMFQRTLNRIFFESTEKRIFLHKVSKKSGLSYRINYEQLREFLIENGHYNEQYEALKETLPTFLKASLPQRALSSCTCRDEIYKKYLSTFCVSISPPTASTKQIYGNELFRGMKEFVKAKLAGGIEDENVREMYERYEKGINVTRFGKDLNEILLFGQDCYVDKIYTNRGTRYTLHLKELEAFCGANNFF